MIWLPDSHSEVTPRSPSSTVSGRIPRDGPTYPGREVRRFLHFGHGIVLVLAQRGAEVPHPWLNRDPVGKRADQYRQRGDGHDHISRQLRVLQHDNGDTTVAMPAAQTSL